jgi:hypothetical protein
VVVSAGNTGYGYQKTSQGTTAVGVAMSIGDPGNAELAMTVGSTHRDMPNIWGISHFSAKGPTLDGRIKPDLVAPGERVVSCAIRSPLKDADRSEGALYVESSGTSLAAAYASGTIACFLSVRRELIGQPETVKQIFLDSAVDLRRVPTHQGRGLIDLARALSGDLPPFAAARMGSGASPMAAVPHGGWPVSEPATTASSGPRVEQEIPPGRSAPAVPSVQPPRPLRLMCSYAHEDAELLDRLRRALATLQRQGLIELWDDQRVLAGDVWERGVHQNLDQAEVIILLISQDFISSDYCYEKELPRALERHDQGTARVIPVIVRDVDWQGTEFEKRKIKALPHDGKPVRSWPDQDQAWADVARGVRQVVEKTKAAR